MKKPHLGFVVRQRNPLAYWVALPVIFIMLVAVFFLGKTFRGYEMQALEQRIEALQQQVETLGMRNTRLVEVNARLDRTARIQSEATSQVNQSLSQLQQKLADLNEELAFYRSVVAPESNKGELNIQSFGLNADEQGHYYYRLVLTKKGKNDSAVSGRFNVLISGQKEGETEQIALRDLWQGEQNDAFAFRYFQTFTGEFQLPEGFSPVDLEIEIFPKTKKYKPFSTSISWADALLEDL